MSTKVRSWLTPYRKTFILANLCVLMVAGAVAQNASPYHTGWKRDLSYIGSGAITTGLAYLLSSTTPALSVSQLDLKVISKFDRIATKYSSVSAGNLSNMTLFTSLGTPLLLLAGAETRQDFGKISLLFVETMLLNQGISDVIKSSFLRPRPYVSDRKFDPAKVLTTNDRASFLSGHTSASAAATFFVAKVFSDYYPQSKMKPIVWGLAVTIPALTGYLRVRSGKHFPSDVIAGYLLGGGIGYMVPAFHKKNKKNIKSKRLKIDVGSKSVALSYRF